MTSSDNALVFFRGIYLWNSDRIIQFPNNSQENLLCLPREFSGICWGLLRSIRRYFSEEFLGICWGN